MMKNKYNVECECKVQVGGDMYFVRAGNEITMRMVCDKCGGVWIDKNPMTAEEKKCIEWVMDLLS